MTFYVGGLLQLPQEEFRARLDAAMAAVFETGAEMIAAERARTPDPRGHETYRAWLRSKMVCAVVVKHVDREKTIELSRDGGGMPHAYIDPKRLLIQPESTDRFLLIVLPRALANWVREKQDVVLLAVPPKLSSDVEWTESEREAWRSLTYLAGDINGRIRIAKTLGRRRPSRLPFGGTA